MSINALTNAAMARRVDFEPANTVPATLTDIANAAAGVSKPAGLPASANLTTANAAIQTITTYIPTEVLTLYVATLAALTPTTVALKGQQLQEIGTWAPFWVFLVLTPIVVWVAFATKIRAAGKPIPVSPGKWPLWEMSAATIAYCAWAFALPTTPFAIYGLVYSRFGGSSRARGVHRARASSALNAKRIATLTTLQRSASSTKASVQSRDPRAQCVFIPNGRGYLSADFASTERSSSAYFYLKVGLQRRPNGLFSVLPISLKGA